MPACDLSVIIVSWNVQELLNRCLEGIEAASRPAAAGLRSFGAQMSAATFEVIVVDNASTDGTAGHLAERFPWARVLANEQNLGFTAGNNRGYALSGGSHIYFLNPDTELVGDSLWVLYAAICDEERVAAVGPQLRYGDGSVQNSRRRFPGRLTGFFESTWLARSLPNNPWLRRQQMLDWPADCRQDVDWLVGAAMLCRREALEAVRQPGAAGPFDETFFMYSEEVDLCRRLKAAGWRVVFVPEALVIHHEGRSSEQVVAARHIHFNTSKVRYWRKWFGPAWGELLRRYLLFEFRLQLWEEWAKRLLGHRRELRQARIDAYRQVLASRLE